MDRYAYDVGGNQIVHVAGRLSPVLLLAAACVSLGGCVAGTVAGAAVGVAATTVKTGVKVTGAVAGAGVHATSAVVHAATGGGKS